MKLVCTTFVGGCWVVESFKSGAPVKAPILTTTVAVWQVDRGASVTKERRNIVALFRPFAAEAFELSREPLTCVDGSGDESRRPGRQDSFGGAVSVGFRTESATHPPPQPLPPRGLTSSTPATETKRAFDPVGRRTYSALCLYLAASSSRRALVESCRSHLSRVATPAVSRLAIPNPHPVRLSSTQMRWLARTKNRCIMPTPAAAATATNGADAGLPKGPLAGRFGGDDDETARCVPQDSKTWIQHPRICELSFPVVASVDKAAAKVSMPARRAVAAAAKRQRIRNAE
jgi:hypothetical protein